MYEAYQTVENTVEKKKEGLTSDDNKNWWV
jgi:hypothetical protein